DLISRAQLVVLQVGETQGLRWELGQVTGRLSPEKVLLYLPHRLKVSRRKRERAYQAFRAWASELFPGGLPDAIGDSYFVYFSGTSWRPPPGGRPPEPVPHPPPLPVLQRLRKSRTFHRPPLLRLQSRLALYALIGLLLIGLGFVLIERLLR